jgi:predicted glutamine amidotransferase
MYHIRYKNGPGDTSIANTQPITPASGRYVFMHNGRVKGLSPATSSKTDSQALFELITSFHTSGISLKDAVLKALPHLGAKPLVNLMMMDRETGEFVVYHHPTPRPDSLPSLYWDSVRGVVANWEIPNSQRVQFLWRPAYGRKPMGI